MMRSARLFVAVSLLVITLGSACAQYPDGIGIIYYADIPLAIEVSPSGHRLGTIQGDMLRSNLLRDDGYHATPPRLPTEVEIPRMLQMRFVPGGNKIVCADTAGQIHIVRRSDWSVTTLQSESGQIPVGIDVIADPHRAFISYRDTGRTVVVDYGDEDIVYHADTWNMFYTAPYRARDICVSRDGYEMYRIFARGEPEDAAVLEARSYRHDVRPTESETLWTCSMSSAAACCIGPDDDHLMAMERFGGQLYLFDRRTGYVYPRVDLDTREAVDVDFSDDGRWVVVTSAIPAKIIILWAEDLRQMMAGDREPEDVRRSHFGLMTRPRKSCLHPTLNVAYAMSAAGRSTRVIEINIPNLGQE